MNTILTVAFVALYDACDALGKPILVLTFLFLLWQLFIWPVVPGQP
jgi:hypothetical protein